MKCIFLAAIKDKRYRNLVYWPIKHQHNMSVRRSVLVQTTEQLVYQPINLFFFHLSYFTFCFQSHLLFLNIVFYVYFYFIPGFFLQQDIFETLQNVCVYMCVCMYLCVLNMLLRCMNKIYMNSKPGT